VGTRADQEVDGELKELVRCKFTVTGDAGDWILFRMLSPTWIVFLDERKTLGCRRKS